MQLKSILVSPAEKELYQSRSLFVIKKTLMAFIDLYGFCLSFAKSSILFDSWSPFQFSEKENQLED